MTLVDPPLSLSDGSDEAGGTQPSVLSGRTKAALLFAQLSKDEAAKVLPELRAREIERLTAELVKLRRVDVPAVDAVLAEFHGLLKAGTAYGSGGEGFAREVLVAALGPTRPTTCWPV